jgi:DNA-binding CsgD family transcriptional regulator
MTNILIPSGLIDENIEMFVTPCDTMKGIHSGTVKDFFDLPIYFLKIIEKEMLRFPSTIKALKMAGYKTRKAQLLKYAKCRFGGFDFTADFKDGILSEAEYHECGYRGECPMEGIVCGFFKVKGNIITPFEIEMIKLLATEDTLPVISEKLKVSMNTFEQKKQKLFEKLHVLSRARLVAVCYDLQILNLKLCL